MRPSNLSIRNYLIQMLKISVVGLPLMQRALAAEIGFYQEKDRSGSFITVDGPFEDGDEKKFANFVLQHEDSIVAFASGGGSLRTGIEIGKIVRIKGMVTYVPGTAVCASACALAWLGGGKRLMSKDAQIGFHAAYIKSADGQTAETGMGNALVGAYVNQLGLSEKAIVYITHSAPKDMQWLTADDARAYGIEVITLGETTEEKSTTSNDAKKKASPSIDDPGPRVRWKVRQNVSGGIQNVRSGPGTMYPVRYSIPAGTGSLYIGKCRRPEPGGGQSDWCNISWQNNEGWIAISGLEQEVSAP